MKIKENTGPEDENRWIVMHCFVVICYVLSLRGPEGFLLDLESLRGYWESKEVDNEFGKFTHVCLRGQVKGEHGVRCHILPCLNITSSGINVRASVRRLIKLKGKQGFRNGPAVFDLKGVVLSSYTLDDSLNEILSDLFNSKRYLFPEKIKRQEEIKTS